jgi:hypothetical protein
VLPTALAARRFVSNLSRLRMSSEETRSLP